MPILRWSPMSLETWPISLKLGRRTHFTNVATQCPVACTPGSAAEEGGGGGGHAGDVAMTTILTNRFRRKKCLEEMEQEDLVLDQ